MATVLRLVQLAEDLHSVVSHHHSLEMFQSTG